MTTISAETVERMRVDCACYLEKHGLMLADVKTGSEAWAVAHRTSWPRNLYDMSRDITDAHIKTALAKIFPNAVFKDKYRY